jgi:hypothetical protein
MFLLFTGYEVLEEYHESARPHIKVMEVIIGGGGDEASVQNVNRKRVGKRPLGRGRHRWGHNIEMDHKETGWEGGAG